MSIAAVIECIRFIACIKWLWQHAMNEIDNFNMQKLFRHLFLILFALFFLSINHVQCQSVLSQRINRLKSSITYIDYINMCMFRKTRLCNFLREMNNAKFDETKQDRELWKRGISQFYSNW
ncbi:unnamed protein product [Rotaria sordida]|uniref:Uncharacterized protein n=1 Tax=Rotaria sordida TaxID=392033 RepID=A0A814KLB6_9BILA|nr:unnamed protein product [Rotaria sordida]